MQTRQDGCLRVPRSHHRGPQSGTLARPVEHVLLEPVRVSELTHGPFAALHHEEVDVGLVSGVVLVHVLLQVLPDTEEEFLQTPRLAAAVRCVLDVAAAQWNAGAAVQVSGLAEPNPLNPKRRFLPVQSRPIR